jgi:vitamin B12 transporter
MGISVRRFLFPFPFVLVLIGVLSPGSAWAQEHAASIAGVVFDPLGGALPGAKVSLLRDGTALAKTQTDTQGRFSFERLVEGRYQVAVEAEGFTTRTLDPFAVVGAVKLSITLQLGVQQDVLVTASATETPASQVGAAATVIDSGTMDTLEKPDVLEALRLVPGTNVVQTGARGGVTSLYVRGGNDDFNKVLFDGVAANDIGGAFDFSEVATAGVDRVEMLRNPNSVLFGTDALSSVIELTTKRGTTSVPEVTFTADGGNFDTSKQEASVGGAIKRIDYFADAFHFDTNNSVPNDAYHNTTFVSRFDTQVSANSTFTVTARRMTSENGNPNGFALFGIPDDSSQKADATYVDATYRAEISSRWHGTVGFGSMEQGYHTDTPEPTGEPFDPFGTGANYLGNVVTLTGANGYSVTGQAILDYAGAYPMTYDASTKRQTVSGDLTGRVTTWMDLSAGAHLDHEDGYAINDGTRVAVAQDNGGTFVEARTAFGRAFVTGGLGYDHNAVFKSAVTPRLSAALYVRDPSTQRSVGGTKLTFNAGTGIKAPSLYEQLSSLYTVVQESGSAGALTNVSPIGPERSRSVDGGIEQSLWANRAVVRVVFFDNQYSDLIEYVAASVLPQLGVPAAAAAATGYGAYVNSSSYWARGVESSGEISAGRHVKIQGSYTHLHAVVTQSFASSALAPAFNPAFPTIPIGAYGPLVGSAPFRRPANTASFLVAFTKGRGEVALAGFLVGKSDDSTFLSDGYFGNTMLLPNHNLDAAYQKVDLSGAYRLQARVRWYLSIENLLNESYQAAFGFPALPRSFRTGVTIVLGGGHRP